MWALSKSGCSLMLERSWPVGSCKNLREVTPANLLWLNLWLKTPTRGSSTFRISAYEDFSFCINIKKVIAEGGFVCNATKYIIMLLLLLVSVRHCSGAATAGTAVIYCMSLREFCDILYLDSDLVVAEPPESRTQEFWNPSLMLFFAPAASNSSEQWPVKECISSD